MNDLERRLKDALDADAAKAPLVSAPPDGLRRRVRGRQVARSAVVMLTVSAVALVSFAGLRAIDRGTDDGRIAVDDPWAGYEVFDRTAKVGNLTITSPSDWYLVNQWPWARTVATELKEARIAASERCPDEPTREERRACRQALALGAPGDGWVVPMLMLGNTDRGLTTSPCFDPNFTAGPEEAVMTITLDSVYMGTNFGAGDRPQWPVAFEAPQADDRASCGAGTYVYFASGDIPYIAHFAFGDEIPDDERQTLIDAFEGMRVDDDLEILMEESKPDDAAYVIAGGENAAGPWTLELRPQTDPGYIANVQLQLTTAEGAGIAAGGPFTVNEDHPIEQAGGDPVFGAVVKEADGVELHLEEGTPTIPAQLVPLPTSMPFDFDLFFASNDADVQATAVAIGPDGEELATGEAPLPSISSTAEPAPDERRRVAEGATGGTEWALEYEEGRELALVGASDDILFDRIAFTHMASLSAENPMLIGVHDFGNTDQALFLVYGVSHPDVDQIVITLVDGQVIELGRGTMRDPSIHIYGQNPNVSPGVWWVQMPPGPVVANVTTFDAACQRLARAGLALSPEGTEQQEITTVAECSIGG